MPGSGTDVVVFDLGGVLLDWNPRYLYSRLFSDHAEMEEFLTGVCSDDWHRAHDLGADITESCRQLAREHPRYEDMIMAWAERGEEMIAGQFDENVALLAELRTAGMRCLALSNMEPVLFETRRRRFPFMNWFDGYVISGFEGVAKPDPRIYELLLERHRLLPESTVFVDDSARNVEAARQFGIRALRYRSPQQLRQQFADLGLVAGSEPASGARGTHSGGRPG